MRHHNILWWSAGNLVVVFTTISSSFWDGSGYLRRYRSPPQHRESEFAIGTNGA